MVFDIIQGVGVLVLAAVAVLGWYVAGRQSQKAFIRREKRELYSYLDDTVNEIFAIVNGLATVDSVDWDSVENSDAILLRVVQSGLPFVSREAFEHVVPLPGEELDPEEEPTVDAIRLFAQVLALEARYTLQDLQRQFRSTYRDLQTLGIPSEVIESVGELDSEFQNALSHLGLTSLFRVMGLEEAVEKLDITNWRQRAGDAYRKLQNSIRADLTTLIGRHA